MNKKIVNIIAVVLLLFAGFVAVTPDQGIVTPEIHIEAQEDMEGIESIEDIEGIDGIKISTLEPKEPARWYLSNAGGLAIKEIKSRIIALRGEYALSIENAYPDELPDYLLSYYDEEYKIEVRSLYKNGALIKTQWLFKNKNDTTKINSVMLETKEEKIIPAEEDEEEDSVEIIIRKNGFIEVFDDEMKLTSEYTYYKDGNINRIDFEYNENYLIGAVSFKAIDSNEKKEFIKIFSDFYMYNRSLSLRAIERVFFIDMQAAEDDLVRITFPRNIRDTSNDNLFVSERLNLYPEFFGDVFIESESKMIFDIDNRGRIIKQTFLNEDDEILWVVDNSWQNDRIIMTTKTQDDLILKAEYKYNLAGDRVSERNYRNGVLERSVLAEGNMEIEELYINNAVVLRAVWEDGVKISETRVR